MFASSKREKRPRFGGPIAKRGKGAGGYVTHDPTEQLLRLAIEMSA